MKAVRRGICWLSTPEASDEERLHVENPNDEAPPYRFDESELMSESGDRWTANDESSNSGMLAPGYGVTLDLNFDLPIGEQALSLHRTEPRVRFSDPYPT